MLHVSVFIEREKKNVTLDVKDLAEVFTQLKINPEVVLIAVNEKLVTKKAVLHDGDQIKLLSVISGG